MPPAFLPGLSSYVASKLAQAKVYEFLAAENPHVFVATVHPGMVDTNNFRATGATPENLPMDTGKQLPWSIPHFHGLSALAKVLTPMPAVQLPAQFLVWMASPEAAFLRGRCAWANWDVDELKAQKAKYLGGLFMAAGFKGLP